MTSDKKKYIVLLAIILSIVAGLLVFTSYNNSNTVKRNHTSKPNEFATNKNDSINDQLSGIEKNKILLIGLDGADKDEIDRLISQNKLPHLQNLIKNGAYGKINSIKPLLSPIIWTSIVTGKSPLEHGITDFLTIDKNGKEVPVSSNLRKVKALWNIFSDFKKESVIVGWLVTWPAEQINGIMVSDHITYLDYDPHQGNSQLESNLVYPDNIERDVETKIIYPEEISYKNFRNFVNIDNAKFNQQKKEKEGKVYNAISVLASTETIKNISTHYYKKNQPDVMCVYFKGIDSFSHLFAGSINKGDILNPIEQFYIYQDKILGEILEQTDNNTTVFVVSDHGFRLNEEISGSSEIGKGNAVDWHNNNGIIIASGKNIRAGIDIETASVLDIAPTILYMLGLPIAEDFPGRVVTEIIDKNYTSENSIKSIASYEKKHDATGKESPIVSDKTEKIKDDLETLGYLNTGTANSYNNIGNLYMNQGKYKLAVQSFEKAIELAPDVAAFYDNLGSAYKELQLYEKAIIAHKKAIALEPGSAKAYNNLGRTFAERNEYESALQNYNKALELNPRLAEAYNNLGELYHKQGKIEEALSLINKTIEISPDHSLAHYNLAVLLGETNKHFEAINEFQKVLKIDPEFYLLSNVYNGIGVAYFKLQEYKKAQEYFNKTLEVDSTFPEINLRLGIAKIMLGQKNEGISQLKKELKNNPDNKELSDLIKKLEEENIN